MRDTLRVGGAHPSTLVEPQGVTLGSTPVSLSLACVEVVNTVQQAYKSRPHQSRLVCVESACNCGPCRQCGSVPASSRHEASGKLS